MIELLNIMQLYLNGKIFGMAFGAFVNSHAKPKEHKLHEEEDEENKRQISNVAQSKMYARIMLNVQEKH